jgi:AcrR family transcriptional regulator
MSPRKSDPGVRVALIEAAARIVDEGGPSALTIRRLSAEVGTSTMAIYTHFGGMEELRTEMQKEAFERLGARVRAVRRMSDPVAYVTAMGWAYCLNAIADPHFYRIMFMQEPLDDPAAIAAGATAFQPLVAGVQRCIETGRFNPGDPWSLATQLWAMCHGFVTLRLAGLLTDESVMEHLTAMAANMFVGFGDDRAAARRSIERAQKKMGPLLTPELIAALPPGRDHHHP